MTQLEERDPPAAAGFDAAYETERGRIYRALVLATGNRDLAVDAVDRGFARWNGRRESRRGEPVFDVFSTAYAWAARRLRKPDRMVQGFRLSRAPEASESPILGSFDELELTERALLVGVHFLGWNAEHAGAAVGLPGGESVPRAAAAASRLARSAGITTDDVTGVLPGALAERAGTLIEPLQRGDAVKARARLRRLGMVGGAGVGIAAAAAVLTFGAGQLFGSSETPDDTEAIGATAAPGAGSIFTADQLVWERVPMPIREGDVSSVAFGPAGFVAIGQDWAAGNSNSVALISADGLVWDAAPGPVEGPNSWANQLTYAGNKYVVVGSSFNEIAGTDSPFVAISDDGLAWVSIDLPTEDRIQINGQEVRLYTWIQSVTATDDRVMIVAQQNAEFDPQLIIQDALGEDVRLDNWGTSPQGIDIYSTNGELERRISWDELGLDEATIQLITGGRPLLFTSTDMTEWESITIGGMTGPNSHISAMASTGDAFAAIVYGDFGPTLWTSDDGTQWAEAENFEPGSTINSLATIGDRIVALGIDLDGQSTAWASTDLATWEQIEIPFGGGWFQQVQVSSAGIAILGEETAAPTQPVELIIGDLTVLATQTGGFTVQDADGNELARIGSSSVRYTEDGSIELTDPETDEVIVTLDQRELEQAWEAQWREFDQERGASGPSYTLLISEDGTEWTRFSLSDEIGNGFYPNGIAVGKDAIVLTGYQEGGLIDDVIGSRSGVTVWVGTLP